MDGDKLQRALAGLEPRRYEQLVYSLVKAEYPPALRLGPPDGGADTLVPASSDAGAHVFQAKRYTGGINWGECETSLDRAVGVHAAERVTFVFPRELSAPLLKQVERRLRPRHPDVVVDVWALPEFEEKLEASPAIERRFFPDERGLLKDLSDVLERGAVLKNADDLLKHAIQLGGLADELDPDFQYAMATTPLNLPSPLVAGKPYMSLTIDGTESRVRFDAFPRDEVEVGLPMVSFTADEEGQRAREAANNALAAGRPADITSGVRINIPQTPKVFEELGGLDETLDGALLRIQPPDPVELELSVADGRVPPVLFTAWPLLPANAQDVELGGVAPGGLSVRASLAWRDGDPRARISFNWTLGGLRTAALEEALRFMLAMSEAGAVWRVGDHPAAIQTPPTADPAVIAHLRHNLDFVRDLRVIEKWSGKAFDIPQEMQPTDLRSVRNAAAIIKSGRAEWPDQVITATIGTPPEPVEVGAEAEIVSPVTLHNAIWGVEFDFEGMVRLMPGRVKSVRRTAPDSFEIVLVPFEDGTVEFVLNA